MTTPRRAFVNNPLLHTEDECRERRDTMADLGFESKTQLNQSFNVWCQKVLTFPGVSKKMNEAGVKIAIARARLIL